MPETCSNHRQVTPQACWALKCCVSCCSECAQILRKRSVQSEVHITVQSSHSTASDLQRMLQAILLMNVSKTCARSLYALAHKRTCVHIRACVRACVRVHTCVRACECVFVCTRASQLASVSACPPGRTMMQNSTDIDNQPPSCRLERWKCRVAHLCRARHP